MDWTAYWYIFCASLPTGSTIACVCLFLHLTLSLIVQWQPLLAEGSDQYLHVLHSTHTPLGVSTQDDQDTDTCPSVFSCTEPIRHYERDQLLSCKPETGLFDPLLIPRLQELGIGHHLSLRRSCRRVDANSGKYESSVTELHVRGVPHRFVPPNRPYCHSDAQAFPSKMQTYRQVLILTVKITVPVSAIL